MEARISKLSQTLKMTDKKPRRVKTIYLCPLLEERSIVEEGFGASPAFSPSSSATLTPGSSATTIDLTRDDDEENIRPSTPPPSTPEKVTPADIDRLDETDGWTTSFFINTVKIAVLHLLGATIKKFSASECYGCEVNHPSQRQHSCLFPAEDDYLHNNFYSIIKMMCTPSFVPAIQVLLKLRRIRSEDARVRAVAETLLFGLKSEKRVLDVIDDMYANLVVDDDDLKHLELVDECWANNGV